MRLKSSSPPFPVRLNSLLKLLANGFCVSDFNGHRYLCCEAPPSIKEFLEKTLFALIYCWGRVVFFSLLLALSTALIYSAGPCLPLTSFGQTRASIFSLFVCLSVYHARSFYVSHCFVLFAIRYPWSPVGCYRPLSPPETEYWIRAYFSISSVQGWILRGWIIVTPLFVLSWTDLTLCPCWPISPFFPSADILGVLPPCLVFFIFYKRVTAISDAALPHPFNNNVALLPLPSVPII